MPSVRTTPETLLEFLENLQTHQNRITSEAVDIIHSNVLRLRNRFPQSPEEARRMLSGLKDENGVVRRFSGSVSSPFIGEEYNEDVDNKNELFAEIENTGRGLDLPIEVLVERTMYLLDNFDRRRKTWFSFYPPNDPNYGTDYGGFHEVNYVKCYLGGYRKLSGGVVDHMRGRDLLINGFMASINEVYDYTLDYIRRELRE